MDGTRAHDNSNRIDKSNRNATLLLSRITEVTPLFPSRFEKSKDFVDPFGTLIRFSITQNWMS